MNEVERLEVRFKDALHLGDRALLDQIYIEAKGVLSRGESRPVISTSKAAYRRLVHSYICHVASHDASIPYNTWWKLEYHSLKPPKKPQHSVERSRLHLREMRKYSELTTRLCHKHAVITE